LFVPLINKVGGIFSSRLFFDVLMGVFGVDPFGGANLRSGATPAYRQALNRAGTGQAGSTNPSVYAGEPKG
jgi:hypothetical protein